MENKPAVEIYIGGKIKREVIPPLANLLFTRGMLAGDADYEERNLVCRMTMERLIIVEMYKAARGNRPANYFNDKTDVDGLPALEKFLTDNKISWQFFIERVDDVAGCSKYYDAATGRSNQFIQSVDGADSLVPIDEVWSLLNEIQDLYAAEKPVPWDELLHRYDIPVIPQIQL